MKMNPKKIVSENLPMDCWELILNNLHHDDLILTSSVCKDFLKVSNNLVKSLQVANPDINLLSQHLKRFRNIKSICFKNFRGDIEDAFKELASNSEIKHLQVLNYRYKDFDYDLSMIATCFPNLEKLQIRCSAVWGALSAESLSSKLKLLKKVDFVSSNDFTDQSLDALSLNCALLEDVSLSHCYEVTETGIGCLLRNRPNLKALSIRFIGIGSTNPRITIENSIGHAKSLASLKLQYLDVSDNTVEAIANAKLPLKEVALGRYNESNVSGLSKVLHSSKDLRKLSIKACDATMKLLFMDQVGQNITHIDIQESTVTVATLSLLLTKCPSLVDLRMSLTSDHPMRFPSSGQYHNIRFLSLLFFSETCDAFAIQMGHSFPNLQILELLGFIQAISRGIGAVLRCCSSIKKLKLSGFDDTFNLEADNSQWLNLEELELIDSVVDDKGLATVAQRCCRLVSLTLCRCKNLSIRGIKHLLRSIKTLKCLKLHHQAGYDQLHHQAGYDHLLEELLSAGNMASLKRIYVAGHCDFKDEQRNNFLDCGCFLLSDLIYEIC